MRVLAMASQKGGSGKTTLSGHLAVQAQLSGAGPVCLIDIDPQGSLADWWNEREADMPTIPLGWRLPQFIKNDSEAFPAGRPAEDAYCRKSKR